MLRRSCLALLLALLTAGALPAAPGELILATTTSTEDSGLLDTLVPPFERQSGLRVKVIAVGTGQALELGRRGDADVLLVHAPRAEAEFVRQGHGVWRIPVFYNDFILAGPADDPSGVKRARSAAAALTALSRGTAPFISRGDQSGTHQKEQELWSAARIAPRGRWYVSAGSGMGETLRMASERAAYTLTDRATFLALKRRLRLQVLYQGGGELRNPYAVIAVDRRKHPALNAEGAAAFVRYLQSPAARKVVSSFGKDRFGQPLFYLFSSQKRSRPRRPGS
ncbi:MAG: substrate-binding domain-containing protein [Armatimonadota bacterium]